MNRFVIGASLTVMAPAALAQGNVLMHLTSLGSLVVAVAYIAGLILFGLGLYGIYKHNSSPQQHPIASCLRYLLAGTFLLSAMAAYSMLARSTIDPTWQGSERSILAIDQRALQEFDQVSNNTVLGTLMPESLGTIVIAVVYLLGLIFFFKGMFLIKDLGQAPNQQGSGIGKVAAHIGGGLIAMNLTASACLVANSFTNASGFC